MKTYNLELIGMNLVHIKLFAYEDTYIYCSHLLAVCGLMIYSALS